MDVLKAVETYVTKMVSTPSAMKVLLLDTHTVREPVSRLISAHGDPCVLQDSHSVVGFHPINPTHTSSLSDG